jgi:acyl-coenzyme A thioesterase PaaI-like protein
MSPDAPSSTAAPAEGPWTFGLEPLAQTLDAAPLLRRIAGLVQSLEVEDQAVSQLVEELRSVEKVLEQQVSTDPAPRVGVDPPPRGRPYVDHARDIGAYNPCFPEYEIAVDGRRASGTVSFPTVFEGPPGVVHGGVIATFFDCVIQHHNCDVGVAGKTTSLHVNFRRPTPLDARLAFDLDRQIDGQRITSEGRLFRGDEIFCTATVEAVAGDRRRLPPVAPRRTL